MAESGEGKSPADSYARAPLDELQAEADERFQEQTENYKRELARWKSSEPATRGDEPSPPVYEHWFSTDATMEAIAPMLHRNPGLALGCDELVGWVRGCNAYKKGGNDRQKYLEIWTGRPLKVDRKTQGVLFVKDPVLCIAGGVQPARIQELVQNESIHDGLLPRFLWSYQDVTPADWTWDDAGVDDLDWIVTLFRALRHQPSAASPLILRPDLDARDVWKTWYDENKASRQGVPPLAREFRSKLPAQLARLWLVLSVLWEPTSTEGIAPVGRLHDAIRVIDYFSAHAQRVMAHFGATTPGSPTSLSTRVLAILDRAVTEQPDREGWRSRTELWDALQRNVSAAELGATLTSLTAAGLVESREVPTGTKKRIEFRRAPSNHSYESDEEFAASAAEEPEEEKLRILRTKNSRRRSARPIGPAMPAGRPTAMSTGFA